MGIEKPRIKICGITQTADAAYCAEKGVDIIGVVFAPSKRRVAPALARDIVAAASGVPVAAVFVNEDPAVINRLVKACGFTYAQLSGGESEDDACRIDAKILRAVHVRDVSSFSVLATYRRYDELIFDSSVGYGGSGRTFDWELLAGRSERYFLAGGISPDNAVEACARLHPYGFDTASGVESAPGIKDHAKIDALLRAIGR